MDNTLNLGNVFKPPLAECIWKLDLHYPNSFCVLHAEPSHSYTHHKCAVILHSGEGADEAMLGNKNDLLIYLSQGCSTFGYWHAVLQCMDDGETLHIQRAIASDKGYPERKWLYGKDVINEDVNGNPWYFKTPQYVYQMLRQRFPNHFIKVECDDYAPLTTKIYRKVKQWTNPIKGTIVHPHIDKRKIGHYYKAEDYVDAPRARYEYQVAADQHPWAVHHDRETHRRWHIKDYPARYRHWGDRAATKLQAWWKRKMIPKKAARLLACREALSSHQCHSKYVQQIIVAFV